MSECPPEERRRRILDRARHEGRVQVTDLSHVLEVAVETVRRDLRVLEDQGLVRRTHGGASPVEKAGYEAHFYDRRTREAPEKGRIANAAHALLDSYDSLFIDEGSTALAFAERLQAGGRPLTIVTHSLAVAGVLAARPETDLIMLGGRVRSASMATIGHQAIAMLAELTVDASVLSASGISLERGLSTTDSATADLKRVAMRAGRRRIFVGDHTKFGISSFCRYAGVEEFDTLITDNRLPSTLASRYKAAGCTVIRA